MLPVHCSHATLTSSQKGYLFQLYRKLYCVTDDSDFYLCSICLRYSHVTVNGKQLGSKKSRSASSSTVMALWNGEPFTLKYLINCRKLLIAKVEKSNETISKLEREVEKVKLESKEENKRIRQYYRVVAYGHSRPGRIVRSAMSSAEKIRDLGQMFSASNNSDDDFDAAFRRLYGV